MMRYTPLPPPPVSAGCACLAREPPPTPGLADAVHGAPRALLLNPNPKP